MKKLHGRRHPENCWRRSRDHDAPQNIEATKFVSAYLHYPPPPWFPAPFPRPIFSKSSGCKCRQCHHSLSLDLRSCLRLTNSFRRRRLLAEYPTTPRQVRSLWNVVRNMCTRGTQLWLKNPSANWLGLLRFKACISSGPAPTRAENTHASGYKYVGFKQSPPLFPVRISFEIYLDRCAWSGRRQMSQ
jgi:hypothetical protein